MYLMEVCLKDERFCVSAWCLVFLEERYACPVYNEDVCIYRVTVNLNLVVGGGGGERGCSLVWNVVGQGVYKIYQN